MNLGSIQTSYSPESIVTQLFHSVKQTWTTFAHDFICTENICSKQRLDRKISKNTCAILLLDSKYTPPQH